MDHVAVHHTGTQASHRLPEPGVRPGEVYRAGDAEVLHDHTRAHEPRRIQPRGSQAHDDHGPSSPGEPLGDVNDLVLRAADGEVGRDEEHIDPFGPPHPWKPSERDAPHR